VKLKYKLTDETLVHKGRILHRIESVKDFAQVKIGDKGGWVQSEDNLSHKGHAWIADEAKVYGFGRVYEDAQVMDEAEVFETAHVSDMAVVCGGARVRGNCRVYGQAFIDKEIYLGGETKGNLHIFQSRERVRRC
jgi:UDP-3-O-[3-hydroxymyristoyl] glucosamine N-acyltransferase